MAATASNFVGGRAKMCAQIFVIFMLKLSIWANFITIILGETGGGNILRENVPMPTNRGAAIVREEFKLLPSLPL